VQVKLLGDACGIFKKNKVHGTSIVLKTIYNNSGGSAGAAVVSDVKMVEDKYKEIKDKLPQLAAVVSGVLSKEGLEVDGVKYTFKVTFGGYDIS
jgi:hypothetical protein